jgi:hypothetical protein
LVIIPKPGKHNYSMPKLFQPIVLLNTLGKLFKKLLSHMLQFNSVAHSTFHPMQFGGIAQRSAEDAGIYLTHLVHARSPVLLSLCLAPILKLYAASNIGCRVDVMSYVDDGTLIAHSPWLEDNLEPLKEVYGWIYHAFTSLSLVLEHTKYKVFHFTKARGNPDLPINLGFQPFTGDTLLKPKVTWRYLGFFFDRKLLFKEHIQFYTTKALTTVRAIGMLRNLVQGLILSHKRLLYRSHVVPVMMYGLHLSDTTRALVSRGPSRPYLTCSLVWHAGLWGAFAPPQLGGWNLWPGCFLCTCCCISWWIGGLCGSHSWHHLTHS